MAMAPGSGGLRCIDCGARHGLRERIYLCPRCGGLLEVDHRPAIEDPGALRSLLAARPLGVWRYRELLPAVGEGEVYTLGEGGTPLQRARSLGQSLGLDHLYIKNEGLNPTGSFKDRGMTLGVTVARALGARSVVCASTGNTSASLAAYAGLAGMACVVLIPGGRVALGKLAQAMVHGATVVALRGNFDAAMALVLEAAQRLDLYLLNSINPFRMEGQKTGAFEVCDQLGGRAPDWVVCPVGNGNNIAAYWKGFQEYHRLGASDGLPRMAGVQAEGAAPIARAVAEGREEITPVAQPETVASAIRIGNPANWRKSLRAIGDSKGTAIAVPDGEILRAQGTLARREGIFVEPASAAALAGLEALVAQGVIGRHETVVLVATGHGLKDPAAALGAMPEPVEIPARMDELLRVLEPMLGQGPR
jgi:threonine synthase